ncbi:hypothetical protein ABII15_23160 [Streptomyces sp. HUAS MG91]|uniref:Uncharacterized protein n=1 Tax=Streptomyces tabacisoli TaxID=3156398 RepID=A0AAU8IWJ9_9ACTN
MSASERDVETRAAPLLPRAGRDVARGVSMADLLASCAAARLVSTPPAHAGAAPVPAEKSG